MTRKSGDRPDANLGLFNFDGRVGEHEHEIHTGDRVAAASGSLPAFFALLNAGERRMHAGSVREITLVLGGVRSGKSRYALQLAARAKRVTFLATAERSADQEMLGKIERHRAERPQHWTTIEEPLKLAAAIESVRNCDLLLVDCLTLFAGKMLDVFGEDSGAISESIAALCAALKVAPCSVVLVSNEVGSGVVPAFELGRRYRDLLGEINQRVAAIADHVVLMVAGLPLALKGPVRTEIRR
jgi:adenosylcobinamide kinase / adenosylcobinamide-phosphate guanylyltransferase